MTCCLLFLLLLLVLLFQNVLCLFENWPGDWTIIHRNVFARTPKSHISRMETVPLLWQLHPPPSPPFICRDNDQRTEQDAALSGWLTVSLLSFLTKLWSISPTCRRNRPPANLQTHKVVEGSDWEGLWGDDFSANSFLVACQGESYREHWLVVRHRQCCDVVLNTIRTSGVGFQIYVNMQTRGWCVLNSSILFSILLFTWSVFANGKKLNESSLFIHSRCTCPHNIQLAKKKKFQDEHNNPKYHCIVSTSVSVTTPPTMVVATIYWCHW